jgi:predicted TPR repeat methyltransferase
VAALAPDNRWARYLLDAVKGQTVGQAPHEYVEGVFDRHMKELRHYRIPALMRRHLKPVVKKRGPFAHLLDIGCGTGLAAHALRDFARTVTGVGVARRILDRAERKRLYDRLIHEDFHHCLDAADETFGLVAAADVFIYTGALDTALMVIGDHLAGDGRLIFSTEKSRGGAYHLQPSGRFAHDRGYILGLARRTV